MVMLIKDQAVNLLSTAIGPNALLSLSEPYFHYGMQLHWIEPARKAKLLPLLSIWRTLQSKWWAIPYEYTEING